MIEVRGKGGIVVRVLAHSVCKRTRIPLITFETTYPRIIHCELLTHGMLNFNSASSRATPFEKMAANLQGKPVRFGANQAGMQDKGEEYTAQVQLEDGYAEMTPVYAWNQAKMHAVEWSRAFCDAGYHKQVYNRLTEPFQMMKTVISGTEFANFFWLRDDDAADPTLRELASCMHIAAKRSTPRELEPGEWHLPYVETSRFLNAARLDYFIDGPSGLMDDVQWLTLEEAKIVSAARCAAVSFRNVDYDLEKSKTVYERLLGDKRKHGSAFQHSATPMKPSGSLLCDCCEVNLPNDPETWEQGVSHVDRDGQLWSAQLRGWVQLRKLIKGENVPGFLTDVV
jgi:hypothetical protein